MTSSYFMSSLSYAEPFNVVFGCSWGLQMLSPAIDCRAPQRVSNYRGRLFPTLGLGGRYSPIDRGALPHGILYPSYHQWYYMWQCLSRWRQSMGTLKMAEHFNIVSSYFKLSLPYAAEPFSIVSGCPRGL